MSRDPSEIILICCFAAQETLSYYSCENHDMSLMNINYIKFLYKKLFCLVTITLLKDAYGILTDGFAVTVRTRCDDLEQQDVHLQTYACERRLSDSETPPLVQSVLL